MSAQSEAAATLSGVIQSLTDRDGADLDLVALARKCQHACLLAGWGDAFDSLQRELAGFTTEVELPAYRRIWGEASWLPSRDIATASGPYLGHLRAMACAAWGFPADSLGPSAVPVPIYSGLGEVIRFVQNGYLYRSGNKREFKTGTTALSTGTGRRPPEVEVEELVWCPPHAFQPLVESLRQLLFKFASRGYVLLRYSSAMSDIWSDYRLQVDAALERLALGDHLRSIDSGLRSDNPQDWRGALFGCRNVLEDLAKYLWRDPRPTYEHLEGGGPGGKLKVTQDKPINRLCAYIHQKGLTGTRGKFLRDEVERLGASIDSLYGWQSSGHAEISGMTKADARSVAIATYVIVGELATRTDLKAVEEYGVPAGEGSGS